MALRAARTFSLYKTKRIGIIAGRDVIGSNIKHTNTFGFGARPRSILLTQPNAASTQLITRFAAGSACSIQNMTAATWMFDEITIFRRVQHGTLKYFTAIMFVGFETQFADAKRKIRCRCIQNDVIHIRARFAQIPRLPIRSIRAD